MSSVNASDLNWFKMLVSAFQSQGEENFAHGYETSLNKNIFFVMGIFIDQ